MTTAERERLTVQLLGQVCSKSQAARALNCAVNTVTNMLEDGRLRSACEGKRVDVLSLAEYMNAPEKKNSEARMRKRGARWAV